LPRFDPIAWREDVQQILLSAALSTSEPVVTTEIQHTDISLQVKLLDFVE